MSDRTPQPHSSYLTLAQLRAECHRLLDVVACRPGAMKLMIGVHRQLQMFAAYKANRCSRSRPHNRVQHPNRISHTHHQR